VPEPPPIDEDDREQLRPVELVVTARLTVPVKPPSGVIVMVERATAPEFTVRLVGLAEIAKSGFDDCTITETLVAWESGPLVPVTVTL
jgi:hypothetical protein